MKKKEVRKKIIEELKKQPIVQIACRKVDVSRATYYRWREKNKKFKKETDSAILEGSLLINDMAESQLISSIKDRNLTGIIYWLKNHHPTYNEKIHIYKEKKQEKLTPEQTKLLAKAIGIPQKSYKKIGLPEKTNGANINKKRDPSDWNHL